MKFTLSSILFFLFLLPISVSAQNLDWSNGEISYQGQSRPAILVTMSPDTKEVKKAWKKFIEKNYNANVDGIGWFSNKDVLSAEKTTINSISTKELDLYAEIVERGNDTQMSVFGAFGYDVFITPEKYPVEYREMENLVIDFLNSFVPDYIQEDVTDLDESVADLKEERADMQKTIENNREDIKDMERKIAELKREIAELEKALIDNEANIEEAANKLRIKKRGLDQVQSKLSKAGRRD